MSEYDESYPLRDTIQRINTLAPHEVPGAAEALPPGSVVHEYQEPAARHAGARGSNEAALALPPLPPPLAPPDLASGESEAHGVLERVGECYKRLNRCYQKCRLPALPSFDLAGFVYDSPIFYLKFLGRYPAPFFVAYFIAMVVVIWALWEPITVNTDLSAFRQVQTRTTANYTAYNEALKNMRAAKTNSSLLDQEAFQIQIVYQATGGSAFSEKAMIDIQAFEQNLRNLEGWKRLCARVDDEARFRCEPGESLGNYVWPTRRDDSLRTEGFFHLDFAGLARERLPVQAALTYLLEGVGIEDPWKFVPQAFAGTTSDVGLLRSVFSFTTPRINGEEFNEDYVDFVATGLYPALQDGVDNSRKEVDPKSWDVPMSVKIYFSGDVIDDYEVRTSLDKDMLLAIGSLVLMWLLLWIQLRSLFLALMSIGILSLACLFTYAVLQAILAVGDITLITFLAVFLVQGIGSNVLIMAEDVFRRKRREAPEKPQLTTRLLTTHRSLLSSLVPVLFTACCFFVNFFSNLRPIREFGLFVGTGLLTVAAMVFHLFVPTLLFHEQVVRGGIHRAMPRRLAMVFEPVKLNLPWKRVSAILVRVALKAKFVVVGTLAIAILAFAIVLPVTIVRGDTIGLTLPEVFPADHQRTAGRPLQDAFVPTQPGTIEVPFTATVCEPGRGPSRDATCGLHWCEAPKDPDNADDSKTRLSCKCSQLVVPGNSGTGCDTIKLEVKLSGPVLSAPDAALIGAVKDYIPINFALASNISAPSKTKRATSLVLENWESGETHIDPLIIVPNITFDVTGGPRNQAVCEEEIVCYCGMRACNHLAAYYTQISTNLSVDMPASRRLSVDRGSSGDDDGVEGLQEKGFMPRPSLGRRLLSQGGAAGFQSAEIVVVFGILVDNTNEARSAFLGGEFGHSISYDPLFDPTSAWSQRAMLAVCEGPLGGPGLPDNLKVLETNCWISDFKAWRLERGERFPIERFGDFNSELQDYMATHQGAASVLWLDEKDHMRATSLHFKCRLPSTAYVAMEDQANWMDYVKGLNQQAHTTANQAWATSQTWVEMEAFADAIRSAWLVIGLSVIALLVAGLAYTLDFVAVLLIAMTSVVCCVFLAFWMFCFFGWNVGPWEVIILTCFLGFSLEPAFRMCRDFVDLGYSSEVSSFREDKAIGADDAAEDHETPTKESDVLRIAGGIGDDAVNAADSLAAEVSTVGSAPTREEEREGRSEREARIRRSVYLVSEHTLAGALKLMLCGIFLMPCKIQLFARLGAVAFVVPFCALPCTLLTLPAVLLVFAPVRKEPSCLACTRWVVSGIANWLWA